jgi:hypothetical protein
MNNPPSAPGNPQEELEDSHSHLINVVIQQLTKLATEHISREVTAYNNLYRKANADTMNESTDEAVIEIGELRAEFQRTYNGLFQYAAKYSQDNSIRYDPSAVYQALLKFHAGIDSYISSTDLSGVQEYAIRLVIKPEIQAMIDLYQKTTRPSETLRSALHTIDSRLNRIANHIMTNQALFNTMFSSN